MLRFKERQLLGEGQVPGLRDVQAGDGTLRITRLERVLRGKQRVASGAGREDLAHIVQILAPGVTGAHRQLFEQVVGAELCLQSMIVREPAGVALTYDAKTAGTTPHI